MIASLRRGNHQIRSVATGRQKRGKDRTGSVLQDPIDGSVGRITTPHLRESAFSLPVMRRDVPSVMEVVGADMVALQIPKERRGEEEEKTNEAVDTKRNDLLIVNLLPHSSGRGALALLLHSFIACSTVGFKAWNVVAYGVSMFGGQMWILSAGE